MQREDTILIVEDVEMNRAILGQMFQDKYKVVEAANGKEALEYLETNRSSVIMVLLDIKMPVMNGFEVMEYMRDHGWLDKLPVILITGDDEGDAMERGYGLGVNDIIFKPFVHHIVVQRVQNVIDLYRHKNHLEDMVDMQTKKLNQQYARLREHHEHLIEVLYDIINYRNAETIQHVDFVQGYTKILAEHYAKIFPKAKMTAKKIEMITKAASMHDVGKIAMPDAILNRPGRLSDAEMEILKEHTIKGEQIMGVLTEFQSSEYSRICCNVCLYHHEKYDGTGYPNKMKKDKIPVEAQIVALADMYDTLVNSSVNRQTFSKEKAYYMLMNGECGELSPRMKECLEDAKEDMEAFALKNVYE